jgi:hypothetical protein
MAGENAVIIKRVKKGGQAAAMVARGRSRTRTS